MEEIQKIVQENPPSSTVSPCCFETIKELVKNNPMMACQHCEKIIKCFVEESAYLNYVKFCHSRKRNIVEASYEEYKIILFRK